MIQRFGEFLLSYHFLCDSQMQSNCFHWNNRFHLHLGLRLVRHLPLACTFICSRRSSPQEMCTNWHFGWFALAAFMQSGRSSVALFFFSPLESRASIRVSWHRRRRRSHSRSTLSPSIMPISPPTLYLNVLRAPMVGSAGPAWGGECGECECRRTRHCSERGAAAQRARSGHRR